jgi:hypothetical protein
MKTFAVAMFALTPGLAFAAAGCEILPDREFAALPKALSLKIADARTGASGGSVDFTFAVTNRGRTVAKACLGPSRKVSFRLASSSGTGGTLVDHPGCTREFTIQPGGVMSWAETLEVPRLSQERIDLQVDVQIVNPRRCGNWGNCAAFYLESNHFELQ